MSRGAAQGGPPFREEFPQDGAPRKAWPPRCRGTDRPRAASSVVDAGCSRREPMSGATALASEVRRKSLSVHKGCTMARTASRATNVHPGAPTRRWPGGKLPVLACAESGGCGRLRRQLRRPQHPSTAIPGKVGGLRMAQALYPSSGAGKQSLHVGSGVTPVRPWFPIARHLKLAGCHPLEYRCHSLKADTLTARFPGARDV